MDVVGLSVNAALPLPLLERHSEALLESEGTALALLHAVAAPEEEPLPEGERQPDPVALDMAEEEGLALALAESSMDAVSVLMWEGTVGTPEKLGAAVAEPDSDAVAEGEAGVRMPLVFVKTPITPPDAPQLFTRHSSKLTPATKPLPAGTENGCSWE